MVINQEIPIIKSSSDGTSRALHLKVPYTPQSHQKDWHNSEARFLVSVCGRQIGKTTAIVNDAIRHAVQNPGSRVWYVTNDYGQAKRNVWSEFKRYLPKELPVKYNNSELTITIPTNPESRIELIGVENADSLRGAVVHRMYLDEYADFPPSVFPEVLRPMLSTTGGKVWFVGTPKGFNHFYDLYELAGNNSEYARFNIPSCLTEDNRVTETTSEYAKIEELQSACDTLPDNSWKQEYLGEFNKPAGTVYSEWQIDNFKPVDYDPNLPLHVTWDFGVNDPTVLIWIQPNKGEYRIIDYYESSDVSISHFVSVLHAKPYKSPDLYTGDIAGNARNLTTGTSPIEELAKKGIFIRTKHISRLPDQIREAHKYVRGLFVNSSKCERFRDCILNYRYPVKKETAINQENEIPIHDQYSHAMRAFEYWCVNFGDVPTGEAYYATFRSADPVTGYGAKIGKGYKSQSKGYKTFSRG